VNVLYLANIFQPLIDVFESVIKFFHNSIGVPWGWAIVLLTVCVRAILLPLTVKQFSSMRRLQQLQPQMKAIQAKYKEDKQRQQQELMKFYKENQINPLASCLPLVAQLPVFISLFYMLRKSLRNDICPGVQSAAKASAAATHHAVALPVACGPHGGAGFLFIPDLTNHSTGIVLIVLIVLYIGTQVGSSLMSMSMSTTDSSQKWLMLGLPLFFVIFVIQFPAGVIVYWITTNTWTILQQYIVLRRVGPPPVAAAGPAAAGPGGGPPGGTGGRPSPNGAGGGSGPTDSADGSSGGPLAGLLRGRQRGGGRGAGVSTTTRERRTGPPPQSPRKKKKRSGRRR
jgi:YidC/Oxa1 family membrane protein insertase